MMYNFSIYVKRSRIILHFYRKFDANEVKIRLFKNTGVSEESKRKGTVFRYLFLGNTTNSTMNSVTKKIMK